MDALAASLRADAAESAVFLEVLAGKLEQALPEQVEVERKGRLFGGAKTVRRIDVRMGDAHYEIEGEGGVLAARRSRIVRGITLKSESLPVDAWIDALTAELVMAADRSEQGRAALQRLLAD